MKEINRRIMMNDEQGMACGPCGVLAVDAEMVVDDEGNTVFLHVQWVSEAPGFLREATTESVYDIYERLNRSEGEMDALLKERDRISDAGIEKLFPGCNIEARYAVQFCELEHHIKEMLEARGYELDEVLEKDEDPE